MYTDTSPNDGRERMLKCIREGNNVHRTTSILIKTYKPSLNAQNSQTEGGTKASTSIDYRKMGQTKQTRVGDKMGRQMINRHTDTE